MLSPKPLSARRKSDPSTGLSKANVRSRLARYGSNELRPTPPEGDLETFIETQLARFRPPTA
jgi:hypothetical protein